LRTQRLNQLSRKALFALSLLALLTVFTGYLQPQQRDEGAGAHIFQISIVLLAPVLLLFVVTTNWKDAPRSLCALALPAAFLTAAFIALYYLEHYWYS
jgi:hypothetical protein